jgi:hypothetical protein
MRKAHANTARINKRVRNGTAICIMVEPSRATMTWDIA